MRSISSRTSHSVLTARFKTEVKARSKAQPSFFRSCPAALASWTPFSDSGTSVQPVKRFSLFHALSP